MGQFLRRLKLLALLMVFMVLASLNAGLNPLPAFGEVSAQNSLEEERKTVSVAFFPDSTYMSLADDGSLHGFNVDYLTELAVHAGWRYDYVTYESWTQASEALVRGEVDILPSVYQSPGRGETMLFTKTSLGETYTTISVRLDDDRFYYEDFQAFEGISVGVIEGSRDAQNYRDYASAQGFSTNIVGFGNSVDLIQALETEEIDALAITDLGHIDNLKTVARFSPEPLYVVVPKDRTDLQNELNQAMDLIKFRYPDFLPDLYDKYFGTNTNQDPVFTRDEYLYLQTAPKLTVAYISFRTPLSYTDPSTDEFAGISASLFADVSRVTGLEFEFVPADSQRKAIEMVVSGETDLIYAVDATLEDPENEISKTGTYLRNPMAMIAGATSSNHRLALPEGFALSEEIAKGNPQLELSFYPTPKHCFDAILEDKADITYTDINVANYLLSERQYNSLGILSLTNYTNSMAIGISPSGDQRLVSALDRCVQFISGSTMTKWTTEASISSHPTSPLDILRQYPLQIIIATILLALVTVITMLYILRSKTQNAAQISQLVNNDSLTGGWSFTKFQHEAYVLIEKEPDCQHAIVYLDINRFKSFNAAFGFNEGDRLLIALHTMLGEFIAEKECYARISADQFVILIQWSSMPAFIARFEQLDEKFNGVELLQAHNYRILLLAGVSVVLPCSTKTDQLLSEFIDCARYAREGIGEKSRSTVLLYSDGMREQDIAERTMQIEAVSALENGEFVAYYQPKVKITTGKIDSFEALVRWKTSETGLRAPNEFIPLFEKNGFITEIDFHVFTLACQRIRECLDAGLPTPIIACNFSRLHLQNADFPEKLKAIVKRYDIPPDHLELELTENIFIEDFLRVETVCERLKTLGFHLSIDDFGKGYSSLGTLQDLPIDVLKLDRSFLTDSANDIRSKTILEGVINIAKNLGVKIIVEGVETLEQVQMLQAMNPDIIAQGFLYSRPVPREESDMQLCAEFLEPCE